MAKARIRETRKASLDGVSVRRYRAGEVVDLPLEDLERILPGNFDLVTDAPPPVAAPVAPAPKLSRRQRRKLWGDG